MSDSTQIAACVACGQPLPEGVKDCISCGVTAAWQDLIQAARFAQDRFEEWAKEQRIGAGPAEAIAGHFKQQRESMLQMAKQRRPLPQDMPLMPAEVCWDCRAQVSAQEHHCSHCGVPVNNALAESLRYLTYTSYVIKALCDAGRLPLVQAHACMNEAKSRILGRRTRLEKDRAVEAVVVAESAASGASPASSQPSASTSAGGSPPRSPSKGDSPNFADTKKGTVPAASPKPPRRPLLEIILDPRTTQWFFLLGGGLAVLGLIILLATMGIFKNPIAVAVALGIGNAAVLAGGWAVIRFSRYQTAGRAITLLACLVMPLNLWFYHSYNLITIGGNLWAAAVVICVLYLASALVLRDHLFIYVLNGGIAMTGLLMLADAGMFWEIASPAALLVVLGLISIHVERAFPEIEGPFSRRRFGMACFQSGQVLLAAGLLLVLGAQIVGDWLWPPIFEALYQHWKIGQPAIITELWGQYLALALVLAGTYSYFYSDIVVRRLGLYVYLAVFTLLWAEMLVIELVAKEVTSEAAIIAMALTALAANLLQPKLVSWQKPLSGGKPDNFASTAVSLVRAGQPLGLFLSTVPVLLGILLHLRATYQPLNNLWLVPGGGHYAVTWLYVAAMLVTAVSCRVGAHLYRHSLPWLASTYFFGTAAATLTGLAGVLSLLHVHTWDQMAPLMMIVPILYMIAARFYRGHSQETPLVWVSHSATGVMLVAVVAAALNLTPKHVFEPNPLMGVSENLLLAAFFAEAAVFYVLATVFRKQGMNIYLATAMACGAVWQLLQYYNVSAEYYTLAFAVLGLALLICYRLAMLEWTGLADAAFQCANALMSLSFGSAALITLSRLAAHRDTIDGSLVFLLLALLALTLLAAWLVQHAGCRRWYIVMAIVETGLALFTLNVLSHLTIWDKLEIFCVFVGIALLVVGHLGWRREADEQNDLVSFSLLFGSLLVGIPLTIAVLLHRFQSVPEFSTLNELGMLAAGLVLLTTGFVFQLRATTITGTSLLLVYLLSLLRFINMPDFMQTVGIWIFIGGVLLFVTAILLSIYRDRLLALPEKVRRREGVFRVLGWR